MDEPKKKLHQYPLHERPVAIDRKWLIIISVIMVVFVVVVGVSMTIVFMMRKGLW